MLIQKYISKIVKKIYLPLILSGTILMIFENELNDFKYITLIRWIVFSLAIIVVLSSVIDLIKIKKRQNR